MVNYHYRCDCCKAEWIEGDGHALQLDDGSIIGLPHPGEGSVSGKYGYSMSRASWEGRLLRGEPRLCSTCGKVGYSFVRSEYDLHDSGCMIAGGGFVCTIVPTYFVGKSLREDVGLPLPGTVWLITLLLVAWIAVGVISQQVRKLAIHMHIRRRAPLPQPSCLCPTPSFGEPYALPEDQFIVCPGCHQRAGRYYQGSIS
jgi:hypothetical protein